MGSIADNVRSIRERIARAAEGCGRSATEIALLAITKSFPVLIVSEAAGAGLRQFGENRVQEAESKIRCFEGKIPLEWHLVGHLQSNKARKAAELFHVIHSVDSAKLARKLSESCVELGKTISVLVQVDLGEETTKFGARRDELRELVTAVRQMPGLTLDGLMTIPPFWEDPERARPFFLELRDMRDRLEQEEPGCLGKKHLSMGMSHDFEAAIREGATIVRIGTALFGPRE